MASHKAPSEKFHTSIHAHILFNGELRCMLIICQKFATSSIKNYLVLNYLIRKKYHFVWDIKYVVITQDMQFKYISGK